MFYGPELATEEKSILIIIFLVWFLYDIWFSEYIKYLIGYSFKKKCVGVIIGFKKTPEDSRDIFVINYYSIIECDGERYLKPRAFSDKINQQIIFVEANREKRIISDNDDVIFRRAYDTEYKIPYLNFGRILITVITLYILCKNFFK